MKSRTQQRPTMDRGKWSQPGVPHKGWQCIDFEDLERVDETCEMCETRRIRYVHYMEHQDYGEVLGVGAVCARNMEDDYTAALEREKRAQSKARRLTTWMNGKWRTSAKGNSFINRNGFNIVLYRGYGGWAYQIKEREGEQSWSKSGFASKEKAKLAAFERFIELQEYGH